MPKEKLTYEELAVFIENHTTQYASIFAKVYGQAISLNEVNAFQAGMVGAFSTIGYDAGILTEAVLKLKNKVLPDSPLDPKAPSIPSPYYGKF